MSFLVKLELTVYLKGVFLRLAVVAVLLQVADGEFFQWKSSLYTKQQQQKALFRRQKAFCAQFCCSAQNVNKDINHHGTT